MSKIIREPKKFKTVICRACGCVYDFEDGDDIDFYETCSNFSDSIEMRLECPFCGLENKLEQSEEQD